MSEIKTGFLISISLHFLFFLSLTVISKQSSKIYYIPIQVIGAMGTGGGGGGASITGENGLNNNTIKNNTQNPSKTETIKPGDIVAGKPLISKKKLKEKINGKTSTGTNTGDSSGSTAGTGLGSGTGIGVDAGNFPYIGYINILRNKVAQNWDPQAYSSGSLKKVLVYFKINKNGKVENLIIKESAGISYIDRSAIRAITNSSPFPPLPVGFPDNSLGVYFMFQLSGG
ncbi:MAG: hypothetical protein A2539_02040 [Elusimicrobia bacterium RIFOXYD2_FULL_34_15]|nr:MAG: hypothetical protein A2539_02040 [Elusimicrobia bacterium RIFOXYD2_FULL_34_15]